MHCIFNLIKINFKTFDLIFSTVGPGMRYGVWQRVFIFWIQFSTCVLNLSFPFYLEFCICVLFYRCSKVLSGYKAFLRIQLPTAVKENDFNYTEFFDLVNLLRKLNKAFTQLIFFINLYNLEGIFSEGMMLWEKELFYLTISQAVYVLYHGVFSIIMFVCFTICASMIPENIAEIRKTVRNFLNRCSYSHLILKQNMFYLMRIETEDIIYISVGGFHVTRSYILSAFCLLLNYGLLINNLQF